MKTAVLSLIIAMLVAALCVFQFERYQKIIDQTESSLSTLNTTMDQRFQATDQTIKDLQGQVQSQQAKQNQQAQEIQGQALSSSRGTALNLEEDFYIFEAYHLTLLAQQNLTMGTMDNSNDVANAIELLSAADHSLQNVQNPGYQAVRHSLETALEALKSVQLPDKQMIWLKVGTLMDNIGSLRSRGVRNIENENAAPLNTAESNTKTRNTKTGNTETDITNTDNATPDNATANNQAEPSGFKQALANTWAQFKDLIKIQRHEKPVEPILSQEEQLLAAEHVRLSLEQIRWAILHNNPVLYQTSIQEALALLNNYFEPSDPQVKQFASTLVSLGKINIKPDLPNLNPLIRLFQAQGAK